MPSIDALTVALDFCFVVEEDALLMSLNYFPKCCCFFLLVLLFSWFLIIWLDLAFLLQDGIVIGYTTYVVYCTIRKSCMSKTILNLICNRLFSPYVLAFFWKVAKYERRATILYFGNLFLFLFCLSFLSCPFFSEATHLTAVAGLPLASYQSSPSSLSFLRNAPLSPNSLTMKERHDKTENGLTHDRTGFPHLFFFQKCPGGFSDRF